MKIGILNLALDNNYGGNLQRFALIRFLQQMGHQIKHIQIKGLDRLPWYKIPYVYLKRMILKYVLHKVEHVRQERFSNQEQKELWKIVQPFYERYVPHTSVVENKKQLAAVAKTEHFDAVIVGSDQVWRASMTRDFGMSSYMLDFVPDGVKKIAYAVSLGVDHAELSHTQAKILNGVYKRLDAVSVREFSALSLFEQYGWVVPSAVVCVDPTMLLCADDYACVIDAADVEDRTSNKIFAYLLDATLEKESRIAMISKENGLDVHCIGLQDSATSIEQWLNNVRNAKMIVTDSFHGVVFSIVFGKPFLFLGNQRRGNARLDSLLTLLGIDRQRLNGFIHIENIEQLNEIRKNSMDFLKKVLGV